MFNPAWRTCPWWRHCHPNLYTFQQRVGTANPTVAMSSHTAQHILPYPAEVTWLWHIYFRNKEEKTNMILPVKSPLNTQGIPMKSKICIISAECPPPAAPSTWISHEPLARKRFSFTASCGHRRLLLLGVNQQIAGIGMDVWRYHGTWSSNLGDLSWFIAI